MALYSITLFTFEFNIIAAFRVGVINTVGAAVGGVGILVGAATSNVTKSALGWQDEKPDQWEHPQLLPGILTSKIKYMAVTDEFIIFTTENNQLMKISISLERPTDDVKYEYLISPFHSRSI